MRKRVIELRTKGLTYAQIGKIIGTTRQYVQQLCRPTQPVIREVHIRATWQYEPRGKLKCESCGRITQSGHIHHVDPKVDVWEFNKLENLLYLCRGCHREIHNRHLSDPKKALKWCEKVRAASPNS